MSDETMIAIMDGVQEYSEGYKVELWKSDAGRLTVRAFNEGHQNNTDVDLQQLIAWLLSNGYMEPPSGEQT